MSAILGYDPQTNEQLKIGDIERRSGLYILGKSGMGKSSLIVKLMLNDMENHHGIFFLDPHGDAIADFLERVTSDYILLDPEDEEYTFGINPLICRNIHSIKQRTDTYTRAYNIFHKLWENEWGVWMQLIIQHALSVFIENPDYTIAEIPLFLRNPDFRAHILSNVRYATDSVDFWNSEYQERQAEAALSRIRPFLAHDYVRHIIGQKVTTLNFTEIMDEGKILLLKLSSNLATDIRKFIGAILISELVHSVRNRPEGKRKHFSVFIDEFQNFVTDDFASLLAEARKFGVATTIAHQERYGQFGENLKILGATAASANKVLFQLTTRDAQELAPEFAREPPTEAHFERALVISQEPVWDMLKYGHANPRVQELITRCLKPLQEDIRKINEKLENINIVKQQLQNEVAMYRDLYTIAGIDERQAKYESTSRRQGNVMAMYKSFERQEAIIKKVLNTHEFSERQSLDIQIETCRLRLHHNRIREMEGYLIKLMQGKIIPTIGNEEYCKFILNFVYYPAEYKRVFSDTYEFYIHLCFGDPNLFLSIPAHIMLKYWPETVEQTIYKDAKKRYLRNLEESRPERMKMQRELSQLEHMKGVKFEDEETRAEKLAQEAVQAYRTSTVIMDYNEYRFHKIISYYDNFKYKKVSETIVMKVPDMPPRVFTPSEREKLKSQCVTELKMFLSEAPNLLKAIEEAQEFCQLLLNPDNHVKVPSGQYIMRSIPTRTIADMTNEMEQELVSLPRFTAYAKVIEEQELEQRTVKRKIRTYSLTINYLFRGLRFKDIQTFTCPENLAHSCGYCRKRVQIMEDIRERQARWRAREQPSTQVRSVKLEKPPPTQI